MEDHNNKDEISLPLIALVAGFLAGLVIGWNLCMNFMEYKERTEYQCGGKYATLHIRIDDGKVSHKLDGCKRVK